MNKIGKRQQKILDLIIRFGSLKSSEITKHLIDLEGRISAITVKRTLSKMRELNLLNVIGSGRSTSYEVSVLGKIVLEVDAERYCFEDPDKRYGASNYNFNLLKEFPTNLFYPEEMLILEESTKKYIQRNENLSPIIQKKELERFVIELSWKSSKIEGNTYTLLDTEKLILRGEKSENYNQKETDMILNHKQAFKFIYENSNEFKNLTKINVEALHKILVGNLGVGFGLRKSAVGVAGSKYKPLDNQYQISEAIDDLSKTIKLADNPYTKALLALLGISYIQPFEDGNKRTARLIANAILLANNIAPLSYRSVDEKKYREAMLVFYELNSIQPFKEIFIEQYNFATQNYLLGD